VEDQVIEAYSPADAAGGDSPDDGIGQTFTATQIDFVVSVPDEVLDIKILAATSGDQPQKVSINAVSVIRAPTEFIRGDGNHDGRVDIADAVWIISWLFRGGPVCSCQDSADANDDRAVDISDGIYVLQYRFGDGPAIPLPFPDCGVDPTLDALGCAEYLPCEDQ
jgi:hypothetical protein